MSNCIPILPKLGKIENCLTAVGIESVSFGQLVQCSTNRGRKLSRVNSARQKKHKDNIPEQETARSIYEIFFPDLRNADKIVKQLVKYHRSTLKLVKLNLNSPHNKSQPYCCEEAISKNYTTPVLQKITPRTSGFDLLL